MIVGLSIGGVVAQQFSLNYPEKVRALILSGTSCTYKSEIVQRKFSERVSRYRAEGAEEYYAENLKSLFSQKFAQSQPGKEVIANYISAGKRIDFADLSRLFAALLAFDLEKEIESIRAPTLVIAGDEDRAFSDSRTISRKIPNAKFVPIPNAGHVVCYEEPSLFNESLTEFLLVNDKST